MEPTPKKPRAGATPQPGQHKRKHEPSASPSKRRRLEEDGVVLMDGPEETLDGDGDIEMASSKADGATAASATMVNGDGQEYILIDDD